MRERVGKVSAFGIFLVALGASLWGTDALLRLPLSEDMPSTSIVLAEHLFLALYAVPILIGARGYFRAMKPVNWLALLVIAWGASGLATVLFTEGFKQGNPTTVILLQKTQPLIAVLLAGIILRERPPRRYWPLFGVAVFAAYLVSFGFSRPWDLSAAEITAAGLAVGAAALWGSGTVMGRFMLAGTSFSVLTAARFFFALPFLAVLALARGEFTRAFTGIGDHALQVFLLALIPGLIGMLIYYRGLQETRASYATIAELAYPATALIVNWIFLDATLTVGQLVGFILLWAAITAMSRLPAQKPARLDVQAAA